MAKLFANSGDPDLTPHNAASDLGLHCLPNTLLGVSRLLWVNGKNPVLFFFFLIIIAVFERPNRNIHLHNNSLTII